MLRQRLLSGFLLGLAAVVVAWLDIYLESRKYYDYFWGYSPPRGLLIALVVAGLAIIAIREFYALSRAAGLHPFRFVGAVVSTYLILETCGPGVPHASLWAKFERVDFTLFVVAGGLCAAFMLQVARWGTKGAFGNIGVTLLGSIYVGLLGSFVVRIRQINWLGPECYDPVNGVYYLALFIVTIKATDTCAFFTGHYLGRHKLIPYISPGKTVEGLIGGLVGGIIACVVVSHLTGILTNPLWAVLLGAVSGCLGQLGDLAESIFKRDAREKDSSNSVPGFGGILDVVDSLLVAAPLAYIIFAALPKA